MSTISLSAKYIFLDSLVPGLIRAPQIIAVSFSEHRCICWDWKYLLGCPAHAAEPGRVILKLVQRYISVVLNFFFLTMLISCFLEWGRLSYGLVLDCVTPERWGRWASRKVWDFFPPTLLNSPYILHA